MERDIYLAIKNCSSLPETHEGMIRVFQTIKSREEGRIGYVAGIISSDGDENIETNVEKLNNYTKVLRKIHTFPIFSSSDIFGNGVYSQIKEMKLERELREKHFVEFWRGILRSGYITDLFMAPGWERSRGATDEHTIALEEGIAIHLVDTSLLGGNLTLNP